MAAGFVDRQVWQAMIARRFDADFLDMAS